MKAPENSLFRTKRKKLTRSLAVITIIESSHLDFLVGGELALVLQRKHFDLRERNEPELKTLLERLTWTWYPRVISRNPSYTPSPKDGRVIRIENILARPGGIQKSEIIRRVMLMLRRGEE